MNDVSRIALFRSVVDEERWTSGEWHRQNGGGKHYLCLAAAWGKPDVPWLFKGFAARAEGMAALSPEAWDRIQTGFMISLARQALESAAPVQPDPKPDYWQPIVDAIDRVAAALEKGDADEIKAAEAAAWAARAAARAAAWAAEAAATKKMAETLFAMIDVEIAACSQEK